MKSKKLLVIFLCFVLFIVSVLPTKTAFAIAPILVVGGILGLVGLIVSSGHILNWLGDQVGQAITAFVFLITKGIHFLLWWVNNYLIAKIVDKFATLDPFYGTESTSPISVIWNILKNFAYIILVFSALFAGFEWLFGQEAGAKRLIFNILIVALIISFTFVLIKELFYVVREIEIGITGGQAGQTGTLIAASLWQRDPFEEIFKAVETIGQSGGVKQTPAQQQTTQQQTGAMTEEQLEELEEQGELGKGELQSIQETTYQQTKQTKQTNIPDVYKYIAQIIGFIFIIVCDMVIFIVLFVTAALFIARYIYLIFLTGVSPIAVASLTFPEFKGIPGLSAIFTELRFFENWISSLVKWLLVVPIFIILVILGNTLKENVLGQTQAGSNIFEFVIMLFVLVGWYLIALKIANRLSKGVGKIAQGIATGLLLAIGGLGAKALMNIVGPRVGSVLTKAGGYLTEKVPASRFTAWMAKPAQSIKTIGEQMTQRAYESQAKLTEAKMNLYRERLEKETEPSKITAATENITKLIQQSKNNPYILGKITSQFDKMPGKSFEKIATNKDAISPLLSPDLPEEASEKISNKIKELPKTAKLQIFKDKDLSSVYLQAAPKIKNTLISEISNIESKDIIKTIGEAGTPLIEQIKTNPDLKDAVNKATKGFISAIEKGAVKEVSNSLLAVGEDALKNYKDIQTIASQVKPDFNLNDSLKEAITIDPTLVLKAAIKSPDTSLINALKSVYSDRQTAKTALNPQPGSDIDRYINIIWP